MTNLILMESQLPIWLGHATDKLRKVCGSATRYEHTCNALHVLRRSGWWQPATMHFHFTLEICKVALSHDVCLS